MARSTRRTSGRAAKATALPRARKAVKPAARRASTTTPRKASPASAGSSAARAVEVDAPPPGSVDLAGALRSHLAAIDTEVRAVNALTERIDELVTELNDVREQQAKRLLVLDELRGSVSDQSLGSFLDKVIASRRPRVPEIVPERLA